MNIFLKAKHWHLFLLFFAIPFIIQMVMIFINVMTAISADRHDLAEMVANTYKMIFVLLPFMAVLYGWYWSIAIGLQHKLPPQMDMKPARFKFFFMVYLVATSAYMYFFFSRISITSDRIIPYDISAIFKWMPLYILSIAGMIYCLYFMAKTLKSVELQREARFADYLPELLLLWIYPVGVWFIQPKVKKWVQDPPTPHFPDLPGLSTPPDFPPIPKV